MAEVLFHKVFVVTFIFSLYTELFVWICYSPIVCLSKVFKVSNLTQNLNNITINNLNIVYFILLFILLLFWRDYSVFTNWLVILSGVFFFINNIFEKLVKFKTNSIIYIIIPCFLFTLLLLSFVDSLLVLFFFIELYGVLYYFFFLTSYNFTTQTILRYKNALLLLLWNNFLTTIFLTIGCFFLLQDFGTTSFVELNIVMGADWGLYFFVVGFFWKLGLPTFHFFKLEIYKYLLKENVFLFSTLTTLINFLLFYLVFSKTAVFSVICSINFFIILVSVTILLIILNLKNTNILQFFALSGVFTMTVVTTILLI